MARIETIKLALTQISNCFPTFKRNDAVIDLLFEELFKISDDVVTQGVRRLVTTETFAPKVADIISSVHALEAENARRIPEKPTYVDYWDRPQHERDEIDAARNECMRVMRELDSGMPVASVMAAYEERIRKPRGTTDTQPTRAPERDAPDFDW